MVLLHSYVARVPMAALVAIMIMVSVSTFAWGSLRDLMRHPKLSSLVMIVTVLVTVTTHDLAAGVAIGVLLSGVFFAWRAMGMLRVETNRTEETDSYLVKGQVFFASADMLYEAIDFQTQARTVEINLADATFWDITSVDILEKTIAKLQGRSIEVRVEGLHSRRHGLIAEQSDAPLLSM